MYERITSFSIRPPDDVRTIRTTAVKGVALVGVSCAIRVDERRTERRQRHVNYFCRIVIG